MCKSSVVTGDLKISIRENIYLPCHFYRPLALNKQINFLALYKTIGMCKMVLRGYLKSSFQKITIPCTHALVCQIQIVLQTNKNSI